MGFFLRMTMSLLCLSRNKRFVRSLSRDWATFPIGVLTAQISQPDNHMTLELMARALPNERTNDIPSERY